MFWRKNREQDLDRELRDHLDLEAEEQGNFHAARRALGNVARIKEDVREAWGWTLLERFAQDIRYALRSIRKSPGFAAAAVLSLTLGIGANAAIFTVVNAVLLKPLPFPHPDRLVQIWEANPSKGYFRNVVNGFNFLDWRERTHSFSGMAAIQTITTNLTGTGDPVALNGMMVSPQYLSILGIAPALGRVFTDEDGQPGRVGAAILSYGLWQSRFGSDPSVIGRKISLYGGPATVVGVMPRGFAVPNYNAEIWTPLPVARSKQWKGGRSLSVIARLKPGITLAQAQDDLRAVASQIARERPSFDEGWTAQAFPMLDDATGNVRLPLLVLLAATGLVLLIACANVANLLLMRASNRQREIAVRAALGAGRRLIVQQLLSESLILVSAACILGLAAAHWGVRGLLAMMPPQNQLPRAEAIHMDTSVFLFALGLAAATAAIFGLVPYFQISKLDPQRALQQGTMRTAGRSRLRRALVAAEISLSLILLAGAGLMLRSFHKLLSVDPGFQTQHILTLQMFTSPAKYNAPRKRAEYFARMLEEIRSVPGVRNAGSIDSGPLEMQESGSCFARSGEPMMDTVKSPDASFLVISPGYLRTMGTRLLRGRDFTSSDDFDAPTVIMINEAFAKRFFPDSDPVGQKLRLCWTVRKPGETAEIVGVAADARQMNLKTAPKPTIFVDNFQTPRYFGQIVARAEGNPLAIARAVQAAIHRVDPDQALTHVETMQQIYSDSLARPRLELVLLLVFGGIAGTLAAIGIYGVAAYSAAQRTREVGIRIALGAAPGDVRRLVLGEGMLLAVTGIGIGLAGALGLTRVLRSLLFEVRPGDPLTLALTAGAVLAIVLVAVWIPANRAARIDPVTALRCE